MGTGYSIIIRRPTEGAFPNGEMSERLKEPVLKTGDAQASVGSNPTLSATSFQVYYGLQKYPRGRRGSPAKGVGCLKNAARVQIPPSAPARRKRHIACDELFHFIAKLIARSFCCSSLPNRTRCRWAPVWGRRCAALLSAPEKYQF